MASLKWIVHSACHVLGYPTEEETYNINNGYVKSLNNNIEIVERPYNGHEFQMPLHYPRYTKADYETMEEWRLDLLLRQYGLRFHGSPDAKREFAKATFLWPDQY